MAVEGNCELRAREGLMNEKEVVKNRGDRDGGGIARKKRARKSSVWRCRVKEGGSSRNKHV